MTKLFNVALGAAIVAGALLLTTANVGKASATDGGTTLSGAACSTSPTVDAYSIDYGTFVASDVYGAIKYNGGTKSGTSRTPTFGGGGADYFVYVTAPCPDDVSWSVTTSMTVMSGYGITPAPTAIPVASMYFSGANTLFRFNNSPSNSTVTAADFSSTTDYSATRTVITKNATNNGLAGDYGVKFTHTVAIPANQPVAVYTGTHTVTCVAC